MCTNIKFKIKSTKLFLMHSFFLFSIDRKKHSRLKEMSSDGVVPSSPGAITTPTTTVVMSLPSTTNPVASILGSTNGMETVTSSQTTVAVPSSTITTTTSAVTQAVTTTTSTTLATSSAMQMVTNGGENVAAPGMDSEVKKLLVFSAYVKQYRIESMKPFL